MVSSYQMIGLMVYYDKEEEEAGMGETAGDWDVGDVEAAGDLNDELTRILQFCFVDFMFCSDVINIIVSISIIVKYLDVWGILNGILILRMYRTNHFYLIII